MKKSFLFALAFVATLFSTTLSANVVESSFDLAGTSVKISAAQKGIVVNLGSVQKETVTIVIKDADDNVLINETVKETQNFVKRYNMSQMPNGSYTLTVTKKTIRTVQPFEVTKDGLTMTELEKKEKFIPVVNFKENKLDVNVLLGNYNNITVTITDNEGRKVKQDKHYVVLDLHKRYNLSDLPNGVYIIEVMAGDETFYQTVVK
ncbi:MAG: T9SS type A sorting domain-containing protein [Saprospiraceae bacterium]|nr:T9SS type A sorting domain-containing protein [Saprospiraceae bacterium]